MLINIEKISNIIHKVYSENVNKFIHPIYSQLKQNYSNCNENFLSEEDVSDNKPECSGPRAQCETLPMDILHVPRDGEVTAKHRVTYVDHDRVHP